MTILFSGFGPFPSVPVNATEAMMRVLLARGRRAVVLPVEWARAAEILLTEARACNATLLVMSGVAGPRQPLWIEAGATNSCAMKTDAAGMVPEATDGSEIVKVSIDVALAKVAADRAFEARRAVLEETTKFEDIVQGVMIREPREDNAYVCNDTTYRVVRALAGTEVRAGFFHWPSEVVGAHVEAACDLLEEVALELQPSRAS